MRMVHKTAELVRESIASKALIVVEHDMQFIQISQEGPVCTRAPCGGGGRV